LQTLTDFWPGAFALVGVSGVLEVAGLAVWGVAMIGIMLRGRSSKAAAEHEPGQPEFVPLNIDVKARLPEAGAVGGTSIACCSCCAERAVASAPAASGARES
jgi:hypothetical protein